MDPETLYGPMHNQNGIDIYNRTIQAAKAAGANIMCGGEENGHKNGEKMTKTDKIFFDQILDFEPFFHTQ